MLFSSVPFLYYFLPAIVLFYLLTPKKRKNAVLLLGSLFFYAWGERRLVLMLIGSILFGYLSALLLEREKQPDRKKIILILTICVELGLLFYFKYMNFFIESMNCLLELDLKLLFISLPIGISFYTFQMLSYAVDVYRGKVKAQNNLIDFATYVSFFPQLIAGPIVRYADIEMQLKNRTHTLSGTAEGIRRFLYGLGKKVLIANAFGQLTMLYRDSNDLSVLYAWLYAISFMLQIYYDFSGYSDMAIGLGKMFGFELMDNFIYPYFAASVTEFWRRWHISLGLWFRDYVYIPLGGNKKGPGRMLLNILIVWMLTGLWHGANWNFVLWGLWYAFFLMLEKKGLLKWLGKHKVIGHIYTLLLVLFGFVLFNASSPGQAVSDVAGMLGLSKMPILSKEALYYLGSYAILFVVGMLGATPLVKKIGQRMPKRMISICEPIILSAILFLVTAYLVDGSFNPFLYFRF